MICEFVMFLFPSFLAKPGAEPWRSGEVIRKYAGGSLKVFRRLNAGMFDCLTISVDRDQISKARDGNVVVYTTHVTTPRAFWGK